MAEKWQHAFGCVNLAFCCTQPSNEAELCNAVATAIAIDDQPSCFRFPRGNGLGVDLAQYGVAKNHKGTPWEVRPWGHIYLPSLGERVAVSERSSMQSTSWVEALKVKSRSVVTVPGVCCNREPRAFDLSLLLNTLLCHVVA